MRREGRITKSQKKALNAFWYKYVLELSQGRIDFEKIFGRKAPTILEIGFGMGNFLVTAAQENPNNNYIGIEIYRPGIGAVLTKLAALDLNNVHIYCADTQDVMQQCILDNSVAEILILFPDPWPKKRHHKRRLIQAEFISLVQQKLKAKGQLHIATDWENYAKHIETIMKQVKGFKKIKPKSRPETKFERRGKKLGHKIREFCFVKS